MITIEFRQGVPDGAVSWLLNNVGISAEWGAEWDWCYERKTIFAMRDLEPVRNSVPCITIKDEAKAALFILRWK